MNNQVAPEATKLILSQFIRDGDNVLSWSDILHTRCCMPENFEQEIGEDLVDVNAVSLFSFSPDGHPN